MSRHRITISVAIVFLFGMLFFLSDVRNRILLFDSTGVISDGSVRGIQIAEKARKEILGVALGMPTDVAVQKLKDSGFHEYVPPTTSPPQLICNGLEQGGPELNGRLFLDESWRRASICFISREERIRAIMWQFGPFLP